MTASQRDSPEPPRHMLEVSDGFQECSGHLLRVSETSKASQSVANTSKAVPERPGSSLLERPGDVQACRGQLWEDPRRSTAGRCRVVGGVLGTSQIILQHLGDVAEFPRAFRHVPERPEDVGSVPRRLSEVVGSTEAVSWTFAGPARSKKSVLEGPRGRCIDKKYCPGGSQETLD